MKTDYKFGEVLPLCNQVDYSSDTIEFRTVFETSQGGVALIALKTGQKLDPHTAPFEVMVNVCEGEVDFTMIDRTHSIKAGEFLLMGAGVQHSVLAKKDSKLMLVKIKN